MDNCTGYNKLLSKIMYKIIYERFLRSERLTRLLVCYNKNISPYIDESFDKIIENIGGINNIVYRGQNLDKCENVHIYPQPHMPDAKLYKGAYIACSLNGGLGVDKNNGFRNVNLLVDIVVDDTSNVLLSDSDDCYFSYRTYEIMHEVDSLLNDKITDIGIINRIQNLGFQRRDYSDAIHGVQMMYNIQVNSNVDYVPKYTNINKSKKVLPH